MRRIAFLTLFVSALTVSLWAGKPAPPPPDTPVTATLRCAASGYLNPYTECPSSQSPDRIQGDAAGPYVGDPATGLGAFLATVINSPNNLRLNLSNNKGQTLGLAITIDLRSSSGTPACAAKKNCRRVAPYYFEIVTTDQSPFGDVVDVVDSAGTPLPNGLLSIPIDASANANMKVNFPDPFGRDLTWTLRFNPGSYPGSSYVTVTRTAANTWFVTASATSLGKLVVSPSGGVQGQTDEGLFSMPFQMTIEQ